VPLSIFCWTDPSDAIIGVFSASSSMVKIVRWLCLDVSWCRSWGCQGGRFWRKPAVGVGLWCVPGLASECRTWMPLVFHVLLHWIFWKHHWHWGGLDSRLVMKGCQVGGTSGGRGITVMNREDLILHCPAP
jgi:hypothetical protein